MPRSYRGTTVLITGASSGLGAEFARTLAARGANLVLVARRAERLDALAAELRRAHAVDVHSIPADLAADGAVDALAAAVAERGITVDSLVNNAGFGMHGDLVDADPARLDEQVRLNVGAVVSLTRVFLPGMVASGRGVLVNIASTAAFQPVPTMAVYGATKAFVLSFTNAVAHEVRDTPLAVLALCPGATRTEFFDVVGDAAAVGRKQTPQQVVVTAMRALDARRTPLAVVSGGMNKLGATLSRVLPRRTLTSVTARIMGT